MSSIPKKISNKFFQKRCTNKWIKLKSIYLKVIFLPLLFFLLLLSCKENPTTPNEPVKPPGYQEDIPWSSLADSPWPMYRADPQNTGRSKFAGATMGEIFKQIDATNMQCVPVLGNDSLLYFLTSLPGSLHAYSIYDSLYWKIFVGLDIHTTPVVDNENSIYVFSEPDLKKYNNKGELVWLVGLNCGSKSASLNIDKAGNIYLIGSDYNIKCIDKNGTLKWSIQEDRLLKNTYHSPAFSPDGNTIYLQGETISLIAFDINSKQVKWVFGNSALQAGPVVDSYGNIYIIPSNPGTNLLTLSSLTKDGNIKWQYPYYSKFAYNTEEPAIDKNGNIYFGFEDSLYSINYDGKLNWKTFVGYNVSTSSKIVDINGKIYFTSWSNPNINTVLAYGSNGNPLWQININEQYILYPSILGKDGKLIVPSFRSNFLYIIR
jgi:hypothetical protein